MIVFQDAADRDAVERERRDRLAQARRANARLRLVAEITTVLSSTLNEEELLRRLVRLVGDIVGIATKTANGTGTRYAVLLTPTG